MSLSCFLSKYAHQYSVLTSLLYLWHWVLMLIGFDEGCNGIVNFVVSLWQKYCVETVVSTTISSSSGYNVSPVAAEQSRGRWELQIPSTHACARTDLITEQKWQMPQIVKENQVTKFMWLQILQQFLNQCLEAFCFFLSRNEKGTR